MTKLLLAWLIAAFAGWLTLAALIIDWMLDAVDQTERN